MSIPDQGNTLYLTVMLAVILLPIVYPQLILAIPRALVPDFL